MAIGKNVKEKLAESFVPSKSRVVLSVGEAVRLAREFQEMSQIELAKLCGIPQSTLSGIEKNRVSLGVERAKKIAIALRVHPSVLLFPSWETEAKARSKR